MLMVIPVGSVGYGWMDAISYRRGIMARWSIDRTRPEIHLTFVQVQYHQQYSRAFGGDPLIWLMKGVECDAR